MITRVRGLFTDFQARLTDEGIEATIAVASLDSGVGYRDEHLLAGDFFDADALFRTCILKQRGDDSEAPG